MLTLEINPGGRARVVTIADALYLLGVELYPPGRRPERTPEEERMHLAHLIRERRWRMQRLREAER